MRNSTIEKLKEIMKGGRVTQDKLEFVKAIIDIDCPISVITNQQCFLEELEIYKFQSADAIIERTVSPIFGNIAYLMEKTIKIENFIETKKVPHMIGTKTTTMVYVEESKTVLANGHLGKTKTILDRKIILFLDQNDNLDNNYALPCYIIAE